MTQESDLVAASDVLPVLRLVHPLPGFPEVAELVLVAVDEADGAEPVLYELRAVDAEQPRFLVAVPGAFFSEYAVELDDDTCTELGLTDPADALVLVVVTLGAEPTANLLAPVVINARTRQAAQVILAGTDWPVRAPLA